MNTTSNPPEFVNDTSSVSSAPLSAKVSDVDNNEEHVLMVHFDAIFDMRAAALRVISPEYLQLLKTDNTYYRRQYDYFGDSDLGVISKNQIDNLICQSVDSVVPVCQMSRVFELILDYVTEYMDSSKMSPHAQHVKVLLNFGAYPFTDEQKLFAFDTIDQLLNPMGVTVNACDYTLAQMDSNTLGGVSSLFVYDWLTWINIHQSSIEKYKIKTKLYCPKVIPIPNAEIDKINQAKQMLKDIRMSPYDLIKRGISKYIGISFVNIEYWCELDVLNNPMVENISIKNKT